ncbi:MAG: AbrB/MazE/SpoVT family DNA-binding domain-containing protein [Ruminococcus sp.]|nr:AbrB/MazE/SpoVT family DNA-binding domain-containing protein [Ruminococcus sp.]
MAGTVIPNDIPERKIVSISSKRQITIPQKFFTLLGFGDTAECIVKNNELVIRPVAVSAGGEFAEQILAELITQGLSGNELLEAFRKKQAQVRPAVEAMISDAEDAAQGKGEYSTYDEIFSEEDE